MKFICVYNIISQILPFESCFRLDVEGISAAIVMSFDPELIAFKSANLKNEISKIKVGLEP